MDNQVVSHVNAYEDVSWNFSLAFSVSPSIPAFSKACRIKFEFCFFGCVEIIHDLRDAALAIGFFVLGVEVLFMLVIMLVIFVP